MQEFVTEAEGLTLRLVFKLYIIPLKEDMVQESGPGGYLSKSKESVYYLAHAKVKIFY
jgi:hypothetical protein